MLKSDKWTRRVLIAFATGNVILLICIMYWFPAAGLDLFNYSHVRLVIVSGMIAALALVLSIIGIAGRGRKPLTIVIEILQMLLIIPAFSAIAGWPGGDDGAKIGWNGIVVPIMSILALFGLVEGVISLFSKRSAIELKK